MLPPGGMFIPMAVGQQVVQWQGPYPPPEAAERFEALHPGAFSQILAMAEHAQAAQIEANRTALEYAQKDARRGQWLGWSVSVVAVLAAVIVGIMGQPWLAAVFLSVPVLGVARALVDSGRASSETPTPTPPSPPSG